MKKRLTLALLAVFIIFSLFLVNSCSRHDSYWNSEEFKKQKSLSVADARKWLETEYREELNLANSATIARSVSSVRPVSYAEGAFAGEPDWSIARTYRKNPNALLVGLDYTNPKTRYRGFRDMIIIRNNRHKTFNAFIQLQLFDTAYLRTQMRLKGNLPDIRAYSEPATFTGKVYMYSVKNEFIRGAIYKDGKVVARVFPKNKISGFFNSLLSDDKAKASYVSSAGGANLGRAPGANVSKVVELPQKRSAVSYEERVPTMMSANGTGTGDTDTGDDSYFDSQDLETVIVTAINTGTGDTWDDSWWDTDDTRPTTTDPTPTEPCNCGGGGGQTQPLTDPCNRVKNQNNNANYTAKVTELKGKTNLKQETGFSESKSGTYANLLPSQSTAHSDGLVVNVTNDTKGFLHTHQDDYETGETDSDGTSIIRQPIKMFSPSDVNVLMSMIDKNKTSSDYSIYYVSMITSDGHYVLKFAGTSDDIKTGFQGDTWRQQYKKHMLRYSNTEKAFLKFVKDKMQINGVELYKIKDNGTVEKRALNTNGNAVVSSPC